MIEKFVFVSSSLSFLRFSSFDRFFVRHLKHTLRATLSRELSLFEDFSIAHSFSLTLTWRHQKTRLFEMFFSVWSHFHFNSIQFSCKHILNWMSWLMSLHYFTDIKKSSFNVHFKLRISLNANRFSRQIAFWRARNATNVWWRNFKSRHWHDVLWQTRYKDDDLSLLQSCKTD